MPQNAAGNTMSTAQGVNPFAGDQHFSDRVDALNPNDYYRFSLDSVSSLSLSLQSLSSDATLQLLNSRGTVVQVSNNPETVAEAISTLLDPGTYYIRISSALPGAVTDYNLNLTLQTNASLELFWRDYATGTNTHWFMQTGDALISKTSRVIPGVDPNWQLEAVADFNRDGMLDLLWREYGAGTTGIWYMGGENGSLIASMGGLPSVDPSWQIDGVADFNQDGAMDLLWRSYTSGTSGIWFMSRTNPVAIASMGALPLVSTNWHIEGTADFNGDGAIDLLWRDDSVGANGIWFMGGADNLTSVSAVALPSRMLNWSIEGVVDVNRDGTSDILWRDYASGTNEVWFMGGAQHASVMSTGTIASMPPSWQVIPVVQSGAPPTPDIAGNTVETALDIGVLGRAAVYQDALGLNDPNDYYQFTLNQYSNFSLSLRGLVADADVQLLRSDGSLIQASTLAGVLAETINTALDAGTYLIRIFPYNRATTYTLNLSASTITTQPTVSLTTSDAIAAETSSGETTNPGQFRITRTGSTATALTVNYGLSGTATNGVDYTTLLTSIVIPVGQSSVTLPVTVLDDDLLEGNETVILTLAPGSGYGLGAGQSGTIAIADNERPIDNAGNTLATARNLGDLSSQQTFQDYVDALDPNDFYRFNLTSSANFSLRLDGLTGDADVKLFDVTGNTIAGSYLGGLTPEQINRTLAAGTYYIQVLPFSGAASRYNLTVAATPIITLSTVSLTTSDANAAEVTAGQVQNGGQFTLTRTGDTTTALTINYTLSGTATSGTDFNALGTILIPVGQTSVTVPLTVLDDTVLEANETVILTLNTGMGYILGATTTGTIAIADNDQPSFASFSVFDASGDGTANTVFQGGALQLNYALPTGTAVSQVKLEALQNNQVVSTLGTWTTASQTGAMINLNNLTTFGGGDYQLRAVARTTSNVDIFSVLQPLQVVSWNSTNGTTYGSYTADTLTYTGASGNGQVFVGRGGTDTLDLIGVTRANVASINGVTLTNYNPLTSTTRQAIFRGTAFDYLTLTDGREVYFQGIESLKFADGSLSLQVTPNDSNFGKQWNLHVTDVGSAWRFTQGANNVLLVSWDSGIGGTVGTITDINPSRLITDSRSASDEPAFDDFGYLDSGHGHMAVNVMAGTVNNASGISGINWNSRVLVHDVYGDYYNPTGTFISLTSSISEAMTFARQNGYKVVFQGGVQGYYWLNGVRSQLEQLIQQNSDIALFAVAAGNGGLNIDDQSSSDSYTYGGGVASLQTTHSNVMAVGALRPGGDTNRWYTTGTGVKTVGNLTNATAVSLADYSNWGNSLTLVAPTDVPAMGRFGDLDYFGGTSAANPNMAAIASLVWSANTSLNATQVRQLLIDTATDLGVVGKDTTFGYGLVNADAAVRRATALTRNASLSNLFTGRLEFA